MNYEAEKQAILSETDFLAIANRLVDYAEAAAEAARRGDTASMHVFIRLGHWAMFHEAGFRWHPIGLPIRDEHTYAVVKDVTVEAFAAVVELDPPPMSFNEVLALATASRDN